MRVLVVVLLAALGACAGNEKDDPGHIPGFSVSSWLAAGDTVEVSATHYSYDHLIERVVLVAPGGRIYPPTKLVKRSGKKRKGPAFVDRKSLRIKGGKEWGPGGRVRVHPGQVAGRDVRVDVRGGAKGRVGVGVRVPFRKSKSHIPRFETRATFRLDDPTAYRRDASKWRIRIHVSHRIAGKRTIIQPAPRPE